MLEVVLNRQQEGSQALSTKIDSADILLFGQKVSPVIFWIEPLQIAQPLQVRGLLPFTIERRNDSDKYVTFPSRVSLILIINIAQENFYVPSSSELLLSMGMYGG